MQDPNEPYNWQDVPDSVLEELYRQMDGGDLDPLDFMETDAEVTVEEQGGRDTLPSLFPTSSYVDVSRVKAEQLHSWAQPQPDNYPAAGLISQIIPLVDKQVEQIENMHVLQKQVCANPEMELITQLQQQQYSLNQQIEMELKELRNINYSLVLNPQELHQSRVIAQKLQIQQNMLELYRRELVVLTNPSIVEPLIMLVIEDQPIPQVIFKGKSLEDRYTLKLLTSSNVTFPADTDRVKCHIVSEERSWKTAKPLENDETALDIPTRVATFHQLKLQVSTRMSMVNLKFVLMQTKGNKAQPVAQSELSCPLIVITNESQWCDAAGKLVLSDSFGNESEVSWAQFANGLHRHFLKATKQEPLRPVRGIKAHEFEYFHRKFFGGQPTVSTVQFSKFWGWFGHITLSLRFKRHVGTMWLSGLIYGLLTKGESTTALQNEIEGSFLIRFSESYPGLFAVAYVSDDPTERVKHYLVKPEDTGSQKTLPDFLREKPQFKYLMVADVTTGQLSRSEKDCVLHSMYSKTKQLNSQTNGYVLL